MNTVDPFFGAWLSGLADGEGSFNILVTKQTSSCTFHIALRADDTEIIHAIQRTIGYGRIHHEKKGLRGGRNNNASLRWVVSRSADCLALVALFNSFPLRTKKRRDFLVWAEAVRYLSDNLIPHSGRNR